MNTNRTALIVWGFMVLLFVGALVWAKTSDPFRRVEFSIKTEGKTKGMVILPKPERARPVIIYLHGLGSSCLTDGRELRQWAELGFAVVAFDYNQTNYEVFEKQFSAVLEYAGQQPWAMTDHTTWIGFSQGAQYSLRYLLKHSQIRPQLLVRMSGGWVDELGEAAGGLTNFGRLKISDLKFRTLIVHGERDDVFSPGDARKLAGLLASNGAPVDLKILPEVRHTFDLHRATVVRVIGEYCRARLMPSEHPEPEFPQPCPIPFLVCAAPAFFWLGAWYYLSRRGRKETVAPPLTKLEISLRVVVAALTMLALVRAGLCLVPPRMEVSEQTLEIARNHLIPSQWKEDFEVLAGQPIWKGQKLGTLLTQVELANYNARELINWKLDDSIYRDFVLSPSIAPGSDIELTWRRPLWEFFYPRIAKEETPTAAAANVVRTLRERITIWPSEGTNAPYSKNWPHGIQTIWDQQITDQEGFELIYVAALRSVGVPARLDSFRKTEFWDAGQWRAAPRPLLSTWRDFATTPD